MDMEERKALAGSYLGQSVDIIIDRPVGYVHRKGSYTLTYPINYGYIPDVSGGDGEPLDVYLLGVDEPFRAYSAKIIGVVYRENDVEDKLVAAPAGLYFNQAEIARSVYFQERYYKTYIDALYQKSCGAVVFTRENGCIRYVIVRSKEGVYGFPKGHMECCESETETALREIEEETGLSVNLVNGFRTEERHTFMLRDKQRLKHVVYFLAEYSNQVPKAQESELRSIHLMTFDCAMQCFQYESEKRILREAHTFLMNHGIAGNCIFRRTTRK